MEFLPAPQYTNAMLRPFFPPAGEGDDHFNRLFHVLHGYPLEPRMKIVLTGENVGRRQPHERQPAAVGASTDRPFDHGDTAASDRFACVLEHSRMLIENLLE